MSAHASWLDYNQSAMELPRDNQKPNIELSFLQTQYLTDPIITDQFNSFSYILPRYTSFSSGERFSHAVDLNGVLPLSEGGESHFFIPDLYAEWSLPRSPGMKLSIGRKVQTWSMLDSEVNMGLWQPLFRWDHARPIQMGFTGLFFEQQWKSASLRLFASPAFLPDQQPEFEVVDGRITSGNRWMRPPVSALEFGKTDSEIHYTVQEPQFGDVVKNDSYAASGRLGEEEGAWVQLSWTHKPMNQFHLGIEIEDSYRTDDDKFEPIVHPVIVKHDLVTFESGFRDPDWHAYASVTSERIQDPELSEDWEQTELIDSDYWGLAFSHRLGVGKRRYGWLNWSYAAREKKPQGEKVTRIEGEVEASTQRMAFENWLTLKWRNEWRFKAKRGLASTLAYHYSPSDDGEWISGDVVFHINPTWSVFTSFDVFGVRDEESDSPSFITYYQNNDRVQGGMQYVF